MPHSLSQRGPPELCELCSGSPGLEAVLHQMLAIDQADRPSAATLNQVLTRQTLDASAMSWRAVRLTLMIRCGALVSGGASPTKTWTWGWTLNLTWCTPLLIGCLYLTWCTPLLIGCLFAVSEFSILARLIAHDDWCS